MIDTNMNNILISIINNISKVSNVYNYYVLLFSCKHCNLNIVFVKYIVLYYF